MDNTTLYEFGVCPRAANAAIRALVRMANKYPTVTRQLRAVGPNVRYFPVEGGSLTVNREEGVISIVTVESNVHPLPHVDGVAHALAAIATAIR